jgi:hypothetical protein
MARAYRASEPVRRNPSALSELVQAAAYSTDSWLAASAMLLLALAGCGRSDIATVTGRVTFRGAAVPDADVRFILANRPEAVGRTGPGGVYHLSTFRRDDGCFVGKATVAISPWAEGFESRPDDHLTGRKPEPPMPRPDIPERYRQPHTSPLSADIVPGRQNVHDFELGQ